MLRVYSSSREAVEVCYQKAKLYKCKKARLWYNTVYGVYLIAPGNIVPHDVSVTHGNWVNFGCADGGDGDVKA